MIIYHYALLITGTVKVKVDVLHINVHIIRFVFNVYNIPT